MSYRVLHLVDHWLPETMNWLEALLRSTLHSCSHFIYCEYLSREPVVDYPLIRKVSKTSYPVSAFERIKQGLSKAKMIKHLDHWLASNTIDVVHVHFGHMAIRYKDWLIGTHKPIVVSLYGFDYEHLVFKDPQVADHYRELASKGARFIVEGNYSRQLLINYGIAVNQIFIVHLLFHRKHFSCFLPWNQPIRFVQVATYTEKKNQLGFLEALQDRHAGKFTFSFYGEFQDTRYVKELRKVIQTKPKQCIMLKGKLSFSDYLDTIIDAHFCVQWSRKSGTMDTEGGCPVFIKDSLSLARPIVGSKHCDIPDILVHGWNAYLTDEQDQIALTALLDEIQIMNENAYLKMQRNALQSVLENIKGNLSGNELTGVYKSISGNLREVYSTDLDQ